MAESHEQAYEVFISYSSKDKRWADAACAVLERNRIRCWVAPRDIVPGTEWGAAIIGGMDASKVMVLIFSEHANQSSQVRREVERAIGKGLFVIPFRVENVAPAGAMEYALSNTHFLDGFTPPVEKHLEVLARSVKALLNTQRTGAGSTSGANAVVGAVAPEAEPEGRRSFPDRRLLIAGACALLTVAVAAGFMAQFRGKGQAEPVVAVAANPSAPTQTDQERIQGSWQVLEQEIGRKGGVSKVDLSTSRQIWKFRGADLVTVRLSAEGKKKGEGANRGVFSLRADGEKKRFDFNGTTPDDSPLEWRGIYAFEGEFLKIGVRRRGNNPGDPPPERPETFGVKPGTPGQYLKFRRVGD